MKNAVYFWQKSTQQSLSLLYISVQRHAASRCFSDSHRGSEAWQETWMKSATTAKTWTKQERRAVDQNCSNGNVLKKKEFTKRSHQVADTNVKKKKKSQNFKMIDCKYPKISINTHFSPFTQQPCWLFCSCTALRCYEEWAETQLETQVVHLMSPLTIRSPTRHPSGLNEAWRRSVAVWQAGLGWQGFPVSDMWPLPTIFSFLFSQNN